MSDTPETDAIELPSEVLLIASEKYLGHAITESILILGNHARKLERKNTELQKQIEILNHDIKLLISALTDQQNLGDQT